MLAVIPAGQGNGRLLFKKPVSYHDLYSLAICTRDAGSIGCLYAYVVSAGHSRGFVVTIRV